MHVGVSALPRLSFRRVIYVLQRACRSRGRRPGTASQCLFDLDARATHPCSRGSRSTPSDTLSNKYDSRGQSRDSLLLLPTRRTPRDRMWHKEISEDLARCGSPFPVPRAVWSCGSVWVSYEVVLADTCTLAARIFRGLQQHCHPTLLFWAEDASSSPGHSRPPRRRRKHATAPSTRTCITRSPWGRGSVNLEPHEGLHMRVRGDLG